MSVPISGPSIVKNVQEERKKCFLCTGRQCEWVENGVGEKKVNAKKLKIKKSSSDHVVLAGKS